MNQFGADYSRQETRGFDSCRGFFDPVTFDGGGCFANEPDRDGYTRDAASLRAALRNDQDAFSALVARYQKRAFWIGFHVPVTTVVPRRSWIVRRSAT